MIIINREMGSVVEPRARADEVRTNGARITKNDSNEIYKTELTVTAGAAAFRSVENGRARKMCQSKFQKTNARLLLANTRARDTDVRYSVISRLSRAHKTDVTKSVGAGEKAAAQNARESSMNGGEEGTNA